MMAEIYIIGVEDPYRVWVDDWNEFEIYYLGGNVKKFIKVNDDVWINMDQVSIVRRIE